jgi:hypothetical protein
LKVKSKGPEKFDVFLSNREQCLDILQGYQKDWTANSILRFHFTVAEGKNKAQFVQAGDGKNEAHA